MSPSVHWGCSLPNRLTGSNKERPLSSLTVFSDSATSWGPVLPGRGFGDLALLNPHRHPGDSMTKTRPICRWGNQGLRAAATCLPCSVCKWQGRAALLARLGPEWALPTDLSHGGAGGSGHVCAVHLSMATSPTSLSLGPLLSCRGLRDSSRPGHLALSVPSSSRPTAQGAPGVQ